jgi:hypothetical protein
MTRGGDSPPGFSAAWGLSVEENGGLSLVREGKEERITSCAGQVSTVVGFIGQYASGMVITIGM